jgi:hypothetical protein
VTELPTSYIIYGPFGQKVEIMGQRRNTLLIQAERVVIEHSPGSLWMNILISSPSDGMLIKLIADAGKLLETRAQRARTESSSL